MVSHHSLLLYILNPFTTIFAISQSTQFYVLTSFVLPILPLPVVVTLRAAAVPTVPSVWDSWSGSGLYSSMTGMVTAHWTHGAVQTLLSAVLNLFTAFLFRIRKKFLWKYLNNLHLVLLSVLIHSFTTYPRIPLDACVFQNGSASCLLRALPSVNTYQLHSGCVSEPGTVGQLESQDFEFSL